MKRQASVGMFYLYTFLVVIGLSALCSCSSNRTITNRSVSTKDRQFVVVNNQIIMFENNL